MNSIHFRLFLNVSQTASHLPHHFLEVVGDFELKDFKLAEPLKKGVYQ
jgi:hypothetical protein